jgi:Adhesion protein FadA.
MKKLLLVGCILLSGAVSFGLDFSANVDDLDARLADLIDQERALVAAQQEEANEAAEKIKQLRAMHAEVSSKEKALAGRRGDQFKELAAQYKEVRRGLEAEIKENERIVANFRGR